MAQQPRVSDDEVRETLEPAQLKLQRERGTDVAIFSPGAAWADLRPRIGKVQGRLSFW
jgi:hypothetical protein